VTLSSISKNGFGTVRRQYAQAPAKGQVARCANLQLVIGELREGPLHRELKRLYGDVFEVRVDGYVVDVVRADGELVEIQTGGFSALRPKLDALLDRHRMRIVHPVPAERRIVRVDADGEIVSSRPSPKRPGPAAIFEGLVSFPTLLSHPNLVVEVLLCREDHVRAPAPVRGRRFMRDPGERRLSSVLSRVELSCAADLGELAPSMSGEFTTRELAVAMGVPLPLAQKAAACLRALEVFEPAGMRGRAPLHRRRTAGIEGGAHERRRATGSRERRLVRAVPD
jgi:hypothetical protein